MPQLPCFEVKHSHRTLSCSKGIGNGIAHPEYVAFSGLELVHNELDEMVFVAVQLFDFGQFANLAVNSYLGVTLAAHGVEELAVMALSAPDQGSQEQALAAFVLSQYQFHDFFVGVAHHLLARDGRVGGGCAGEEQAQEIRDFGNGADCGTRVGARGFLFYCNDGAEPFYAFDLGLFEYSYEMLGIGGQGVEIAPLPFGVDGVEGE